MNNKNAELGDKLFELPMSFLWTDFRCETGEEPSANRWEYAPINGLIQHLIKMGVSFKEDKSGITLIDTAQDSTHQRNEYNILAGQKLEMDERFKDIAPVNKVDMYYNEVGTAIHARDENGVYPLYRTVGLMSRDGNVLTLEGAISLPIARKLTEAVSGALEDLYSSNKWWDFLDKSPSGGERYNPLSTVNSILAGMK
jgi:hypothetical protein